MSKWYIACGIAAYALYKVIEFIFGDGDLIAIMFVSTLAAWLFGYSWFKKKASLFGAIILTFPLLGIVALLGLRYFSVVQSQDWIIWALGLVLAIVCAALFQRIQDRLG